MFGEKGKYRQLLANVEPTIPRNFEAYELVRQLGELPDTLQSRILNLFRRPEGTVDSMEIKAYEEVRPTLRFRFEGALKAHISWTRRPADGDFAAEFANEVTGSISDPAGSGWFSMKFGASFWEVRKARSLGFFMAGTFDCAFEMTVEVRGWDHEGRHFAIGLSKLVKIEPVAQIRQITIPLMMPPQLVFDETREPNVVMYLLPQKSSFTIDHIFMRLIWPGVQ